MRLRLLLLMLAPACTERVELPADDVGLQVTAGASEVEFGRPIPLTVVRSWRKGLVPQEWSPQALAPLRLRLVRAERHGNATHVQDIRQYDAFVFGRDLVQLTVPEFRARGADGSEHAAPGPHLAIRVRSALPAGDAGAAELPSDLLPEPARFDARWIAVAGVAALCLLAWSRWRRAAPARALRAPLAGAARVAHEVALARLAQLRARSVEGRAATEAFFVELAAIVRDYVAARFAVASGERTTDEILAAPRLLLLPADVHAAAAQPLNTCDMVKFARVLPAGDARARATADVERFVRQTSGGTP